MQTVQDKALVQWSATILAMFAVLALAWWFTHDPTADFVPHHPGMDGRAAALASGSHDLAPAETIQIGEYFTAYDGIPSTMIASWPRFRGPRFDNVSSTSARLADSWPAGGPRQLWSVELGEGHAAPAVRHGRVYVLDYDEANKSDALRCFSLDDGREIWRRWYRVHLKRNHGFSRTIPAVSDSVVVTIGPRCHVMAVDAHSGDFLWAIDLEKKYGTETPFWYTGQCPLIDDGVAVLAPGGNALLIGVDSRSGEVLWETPNPNGWQMSHSSVMPATLFGKKIYVYAAKGGIVAVSAEKEDAGEVLWQTGQWNASVAAPSPVILDDGRIFVSGGYGAGSMLLQVSRSDTGFRVERRLQYKPDGGMATEQQTPLFYQGHFFCILPKDAGVLRKQLACYHPDDLTTPVWSSGATHRFGLGPYLIADNKLFVLNDDGVLTLLQASTQGFRQLAQAQVLDGPDAWGPMALAGTRLLLRDAHKMVCLDVGMP